ncbi:MAG: hypothetical protein LBI48_04970 [Burkholderiaceae bacterium]|nr:hypothetical protein [Burkholderiaceae bacterium]
MPTLKLKWKFADKVEITGEDIAWFQACHATWMNRDAGAPAIVPGDMPVQDFENALGEKLNEGSSAVLSRLEKIVCAFFLNARFMAGSYSLRQSPEGTTSFMVTHEHVRLLRAANWRAAMIDCKRPYGDDTHYTNDMARILGLPITRGPQGDAQIGAEAEARMGALHEEMRFVLQAYIEHAELLPGDWFVPCDGWDGDVTIAPRCTPPTSAQVAAYRRTIAAIDESIARRFEDPPADFTFLEWVIRDRGGAIPASQASGDLRIPTDALFTVE